MRKLIIFLLTAAVVAASADVAAAKKKVKTFDLGKPFGWCVCSSRTSGDDYVLTGGRGRSITLRSDGSDMRKALMSAVKEYDEVVLDGSAGDFVLSSLVNFKELKGRTIRGINGATLRTAFTLTPEIVSGLKELHLEQYPSSAGSGGRLFGDDYKGAFKNPRISEAQELHTRLAMIGELRDSSETYRNSGIFRFNDCENIIIRDIAFIGPGSVDVGASDLLTLVGSSHVWVDHCLFQDGMDGNFDIVTRSDFVTVSWCVFRYTDKCFSHPLSCLVAASNSESQGKDNFNVTFAYNHFAEGIGGRCPMARFGNIHEYCNHFSCGATGGKIGVRHCSAFLLENNYFSTSKRWIWLAEDARALRLCGNYMEGGEFEGKEFGEIDIPYKYDPAPAEYAKTAVPSLAGPR